MLLWSSTAVAFFDKEIYKKVLDDLLTSNLRKWFN